MGGERNGVERALIDSFLRFSSLVFLDFGCAPLEFFECPFITVCINLQQIYNPRFQAIGGYFYCGQSALRLVVSSGCIQRTA